MGSLINWIVLIVLQKLGANSYTNFYEVDVVTTLARYFVGRRIYDAEKVTIIAMYKAQVDMIKKVSEDDVDLVTSIWLSEK